MPIAYTNARIFTGDSVETGKAVLIQDGFIEDVIPVSDIPDAYSRKDLGGMYLAPSFIDLQIYGGDGKMFSHELSTEALEATYAYCLRGGCTHFMITLATNTIEKFLKAFEVAREYTRSGGKGLLGVHLEGPYINPEKRGAHLLECVKRPAMAEIDRLIGEGEGVFKMMTLAPEQCDREIIDRLLRHGIIISAGHSNATYTEAIRAFERGVPAATHLFNAMSPFHHRAPGMVGAVFDHPSVMASVVCDGIHVDYAALRAAKMIMGNRLFFITDAVTEVLEGEYQHLFRKDRYTLPDMTLSGSALYMMQCVRNAVKYAGIPPEEALRMASAYPAQLLGDSRLGRIAKGCRAEMVVFDDDYNVQKTITGA